jgi:hypothetical protein
MSDYEDKDKVHPVPVPVQGRTDKPFILMSLPSKKPNLQAVDIDKAYESKILLRFYCFHFKQNSTKMDTVKTDVSKSQEKTVQTEESDQESMLANFEKEFHTFA